MAVSRIPNSKRLSVETFTVSLSYASSSNPYASGNINVAKPGKKALGVVGRYFSGSSSSTCICPMMDCNDDKVYYEVRAINAGTYTHTLTVRVLYADD